MTSPASLRLHTPTATRRAIVRAAPDGWDVAVSARRPGRPYRPPIADDLPPLLLAVRHIGPRRARRLLDALGPDWRALVDLAPERVFVTLRGVGPRQARVAADSWMAVSRPAVTVSPPSAGAPGAQAEHPR